MASVMFPDFLGAIGKASAIEANQAQRDWMDEDRAAKKAAGALVPQALGGDREALNRIGSMHPDTAMKIAPLLERMDAGRRAKVKEDADYITQSGMAILSAPPEQQPQLYARVRAEAEASGRNVSNWPTTYDPGWVKFNVDKAQPFAEWFKGRNEGFDLVPSGGGGGAPATGDMLSRTKQVIGGMESSNRYDAVGPDTGGGKKALGKYQVMDFNVGPWTQEALGRALTPEQFLASPQAQEAVADFKLGQYIKQFGSPEAAARAWFAGAGGMNNAGAKDVLGTSVQGYGQKFAQAFGPGATGGAAPPGIAQGDTAPPADASGTPIPTSDGGSVPREVMRMITPNLPPGTSLGRDRKTGLFKVQEGKFVVYDGNKNPVALVDIPKTQGSGPFTGNSVEAQALNMLIANGTLTQQQAADLAAGKSVTDPATGQIIFKTPSGIFGQSPGQAAPQPLSSPQGGAPMAPAGGPAGVPAPAAPAVTVPANPGSIPLTGVRPTKPETMTEGQAKAYGFAQRMATANSILDDLAIQGTSKRGRFLEGLPGGIGNLAQTPEFQRFEQAKRNFMNAQLRDESGAVIGPSEFMSADLQYFPQPGQETNKELIAQMAENRRQVVEAMMVKAGMLKRGERYDPPKPKVEGAEKERLVFEARKAIADGRDPNGVREKLKKLGVDPAELDAR